MRALAHAHLWTCKRTCAGTGINENLQAFFRCFSCFCDSLSSIFAIIVTIFSSCFSSSSSSAVASAFSFPFLSFLSLYCLFSLSLYIYISQMTTVSINVYQHLLASHCLRDVFSTKLVGISSSLIRASSPQANTKMSSLISEESPKFGFWAFPNELVWKTHSSALIRGKSSLIEEESANFLK